MRMSRMFLKTMKETPKAAESRSHELMLRAGLVQQMTAGIYSYLPMGYKVLKKIEKIVRQEMDLAGAQEVHMPAMQPKELWIETKRWDVYGDNMFRLNDRSGRPFGLAPTHEEAVTDIFRSHIKSYKNMPQNLYQIQTKFRDEARPRFGLLRAKEFLMKDAYSFDVDKKGLDASFDAMHKAYERIFQRLGLNYRSIQADSGAIGGTGSIEFAALADIGEDQIVYCDTCGYSANMEKAVANLESTVTDEYPLDKEVVKTPDAKSVEALREQLGVPVHKMVKTLIYKADDKPVAVLVRGDHSVNEVKLKNYIGCRELEMADAETVRVVTGAPVGFAGPGLGIPTYADENVFSVKNQVTGVNREDMHAKNVNYGRDYTADHIGDFRNVAPGNNCSNCNSSLKIEKGIEIGHIFKLGTVYSAAMNATFDDAEGRTRDVQMGCYGIGVSRLLQTIVEQHNDENGIIWPVEVAPYSSAIIPVNSEMLGIAEGIYKELQSQGADVALDDRVLSAGQKFKDADLVGMHSRIVVGNAYRENGTVDLVYRTGLEQRLEPEDAVTKVLEIDSLNQKL